MPRHRLSPPRPIPFPFLPTTLLIYLCRSHYEREAERLAEEASRLGAELERTSREVTRLREWQEIIKKVGGWEGGREGRREGGREGGWDC